MRVMRMCVRSIRRIHVSYPSFICHMHSCYHKENKLICPFFLGRLGIKEVVTLTSDLSRKNLEKDFERMDTPQGTFYRVYFDIYLTLDGSEFNAELVCQGEVMGRCSARFR